MRMENWFFVFVEGKDDKKLFERVLLPFLKKRITKEVQYKVIKYAEMSSKDLAKYIKSCRNRYIFVADKDNCKCISERKKKVKEKKYRYVDIDRVVVVVKKIESWYLAGIDTNSEFWRDKKVKLCKNIDEVDKKVFESRCENSKYKCCKEWFKDDIRKHYSLSVAIRRSRSLEYCIKKIESLLKTD